MARTVIARKRTGCVTCRLRRVKCDENKPSCRRCASTGRTCDGYEAQFRAFAAQPSNNTPTNCSRATVDSHSTQPTAVDLQDIEHLNRCFSTKTIFDVQLDCEKEAKQVLQASLSDPTIRQAVSSLRALREDFEKVGVFSEASVTQQTPNYDYGLQQYCLALRGLAANLSASSPKGLKSALLCCQIFISIEQVRENQNAMAQHMVQGLRIMREYRVRPSLDEAGIFVPAYLHHEELPMVDVFLLKLFAAPCKFAERAASIDPKGSSIGTSSPPDQQATEPPTPRMIAPNMRPQLVNIAISTLEFFGKVSRVDCAEGAIKLLPEKLTLLGSLQAWLIQANLLEPETDITRLLSMKFIRLFHRILKIVLLGALDCSPRIEVELRIEYQVLKNIAKEVTEGVKVFRHGRSEPSTPLSTTQ